MRADAQVGPGSEDEVMSQMNTQDSAKKEAMKQLRGERRVFIEAAGRKMKQQKKAITAIKEQLKDEPKTVPEISEGTGIPSAEVLWYLAALKNYGEILEGEKDGSYFRYRLAAPNP